MLLFDDESDDVLPFQNYLERKKLDFSLGSLKLIDRYLDYARKHLKTISDLEFTRIILRCGAYCGEVVRLESVDNIAWIDFDEGKQSFPEIEKFGKSPLIHYILLNKNNNAISFPMNKVYKYLHEGKGESLRSFAVVVGNLK